MSEHKPVGVYILNELASHILVVLVYVMKKLSAK